MTATCAAPLRRYLAEGEDTPAQNLHLSYAVDQLGSVRDALDAGTGASVAHYDYEWYGVSLGPAAASATDMRYAGLFLEPRSGLFLSATRAYDPAVGRWLTRDPIGEAGGVNLYGYAGGEPVGEVDPLGLYPGAAGFGFGAPGGCGGLGDDSSGDDGIALIGDNGENSMQFEIEKELHELTPQQEMQGGGSVSPLHTGSPFALGLSLGSSPNGPPLNFQTSHYASRLGAAGVDVGAAESAIGNEIAAMAQSLFSGSSFAGRLSLGGVQLEYRAFALPNGTVNVGTIFPVR